MEITLSPEYQTLAEQKVASGEYASLDELFRIALRPLLEPQAQEEMYEDTEWTVAEIAQKIAEGEAAYERGDYITLTRESAKDYFEDIIKRGNARLDALESAGE